MGREYIKQFNELFGKYRDKKIAIYGTGNNARFIVSHIAGYNFVAFVDDRHIGERIDDMDVVSVDDAVTFSDILLIAATPASTSIVFNRIRKRIPEAFTVFDMRGHRLNGENYYSNNEYWNCTSDDLLKKIDEHDVISFDIFDTLVMRKCYIPKDVFKIVERKIKDVLGIKCSFLAYRVESECECNQKIGVPNFDEIYATFGEKTGLSKDIVEIIKSIEIETEKALLCSRDSVYGALQYAKENGKKIYLMSDMYFNSDVLRALLKCCDIEFDGEILVSCEYRADKKSGGLHRILKEKEHDKSILHIGDNFESDIRQASEAGIDSFGLMSGRDMLACSSGAYICDDIRTLEDSICIGNMISVLFNNPFSLHDSRGKIVIDDYTKLAFIFESITIACLDLLFKNSERYDIILFPSRDGFFIQRLFEEVKADYMERTVASKYFYASRVAITQASSLDESDITTYSNKLYEDEGRDVSHFLNAQFGLDVEERDDWKSKKNYEIPLLYKEDIIGNAIQKKEQYIRYLDKEIGIDRYDRICVFDVVTQGTIVYGLRRILNKEIGCITLGTTAMPNSYVNDTSNVSSIYGNVNEKIDGLAFSVNDFSVLEQFLEMIYSSFEGQFSGFDDDGKPVTVHGSEYNNELLENVQDILNRLVTEFREVYPNGLGVSKEFALQVLRLLYPSNSIMDEEIREKMSFHDPYSDNGECFNLMDLLG